MSDGTPGRGMNWLLVWIVVAIVVGVLLIIGVSAVPGYHTSEPAPGAQLLSLALSRVA